ncbi:hypothetical protein [uncultured Desulfobulbus sp.]|uniref:type IV secretory system conjugative DNA transfer family protein n=1 Tax=uncultured Desulfobulbus sp. TaxID=239745 RepID=UPI0029C61DE7|nr:hypothetical protein [uncultured Desulfobulbus sp.]
MGTNNFLPAVIDVAEADGVRASAAIKLASAQSIRLRKNYDKVNKKEIELSPFLKHRHILQALAAWPDTITISLNLLTQPEPAFPLSGKIEAAIVATTSGIDKETVIADLLSRCANLHALLTTFLDKAEFEVITCESELLRWIKPLQPSSVFLIDRFRESLTLTTTPSAKQRKMEGNPVGFLASAARQEQQKAGQERIDYLFPWYQERFCDLAEVVEALLFHPSPVWLHIRLRPAHATDEEMKKLEESLTLCEELLSGAHAAESILSLQARALREALSDRIWQKDRQLFQGACFLCSESAIDEALVTAVASEISSVPNVKEQPYLPLKGGFSVTPINGQKFLAPDYFSPNGIMTVDEAACAFRIPWPERIDPQGLPIKNHRSGLISPTILQNQKPQMLLLGTNRHNGHINEVRVSDEDRMRHTLVMGQTGTGKSIFLEGMAISDIEQGKGICFIDPHGDSIEKILQLYPEDRIDDLVLIDFLDQERIIPFNILSFGDAEERDHLIDDLYGWIDLAYDMKTTGGPIFESYFRSFLRLLMEEEVCKTFSPTIHDFLRLFNDRKFRNYCRDKCADPEVDRMIDQALAAGGDASLQNITPYVTSKLNRFFCNETVKVMTGQESMALNFQEMMDQGKVMLVNLGRGRFGSVAASLLASQIVSRIQIAAMNRIKMKAALRRDFFLYVDEFQTIASEPFIAMLSEARKFKLGLILANQYADQLDTKKIGSGDSVLSALLGNVGNTTCFRLGINDARTMEGVFHPNFNSEDLVNLPTGTCYVNLKTRSANPCSFSLETRYMEGKNRPDYEARLRETSQRKHTITLQEARSNMTKHDELIRTLCNKDDE